jgi:hypothetical protein
MNTGIVSDMNVLRRKIVVRVGAGRNLKPYLRLVFAVRLKPNIYQQFVLTILRKPNIKHAASRKEMEKELNIEP